MTKIPSLKRLRSRHKKLKNQLISAGLSAQPVIGTARERLIELIMRFVAAPGECSPGVEEIGDRAVVEEQICDEEFLRRRRKAVELLITPYIGAVLDPERLRQLYITVAGQYELLQQAVSFTHWNGEDPVTTSLFVHEVKRFPARGRKYYVEFEAYHGPPAGTRWKASLSGGRLQMIMRETGIAKRRKYRDEDFSGLWLTADLQYQGTQLCFNEISFDYSQQNYNRLLANKRQEICTGPCKYMHGKPCAPCPLSRDRCPRARFKTAFNIEGGCKNGHVGLKQFSTDEYCFSCLLKGAFHEEHLGSKRR